MDIFTKEKRSEIMSKIRSSGTVPERRLWEWLACNGFMFERNYRGLPGSPDAYLSDINVAVFIHGKFWHGRIPLGRFLRLDDYWRAKIVRNVIRDAEVCRRLESLHVKAVIIWEDESLDILRGALELARTDFLTGGHAGESYV